MPTRKRKEVPEEIRELEGNMSLPEFLKKAGISVLRLPWTSNAKKVYYRADGTTWSPMNGDQEVCLKRRSYTCKRGEYVGRCEELAGCCGMSATTLRRSLKWLKDEGLIEMKRLEDGIFIRVCGYDFIMGFRRKGEEIPAKAAFLALEEAERRMGGRSMQFDCCTANGEGGMQ